MPFLEIDKTHTAKPVEDFQSLLKANSDYKKLVYYWSDESRTIHDDSLRRGNPDCESVDLLISYSNFKCQKIIQFIKDNHEYKEYSDLIVKSLNNTGQYQPTFVITKGINCGTAYCVDPIVDAINEIINLYRVAREYCHGPGADIYLNELSFRLNSMMLTDAFYKATDYFQNYIWEGDVINIIKSGLYNGGAHWKNILTECRQMTQRHNVFKGHSIYGCSCGGGLTGGGSSGGGGGVSGGGSSNPNPEVCNHAKCSVCGKCLNSTNGNCQKCTCPKNCTDEKCPDCKKCLNPTKPNCSKCECCSHERCSSEGCGKLIRPATRAAMNCTHSEDAYCKSTGPVCECGERHVDADGIPICLDKIDALFFENKIHGYSKMWDWTIGNNKECKGYVLSDQTMIVRLDSKNNTDNTAVGLRIARHSKDSKTYYIYKGGKLTMKSSIASIAHTHIVVDESKITQVDGKLGMYAKDLKVSLEDINNIADRAMTGIIINNRNCYYYRELSLGSNLFCPILETF